MSGSGSSSKMGNGIAGDLLAITYGCVVQQLSEDYGDAEVVSSILHTMGKNMGKRMADEVLAKTGAKRCSSNMEYMLECKRV